MEASSLIQSKEESVDNQPVLDEINEFIRINTPEELPTLLLELLGIDSNKYPVNSLYDSDVSFKFLYDMLSDKVPFTVIVERHYVDRFYRDSYYLYYSSKLSQYSRYCKRVFLFKGLLHSFQGYSKENLEEIFMGSMVIRPLYHGKIGRSLLNPFFFADKNSYLRYATYEVVVLSEQLRVHAFPFSMQDGETTTCAEVTILNLIDYFSRKYQDYRIALPSEVFERVDRHGYERRLPTKGLKYSEISRIFSEIGFYPRLYSVPSFENEYQFKRNMHYYVESGIPVAVGIQRLNSQDLHSITCIGHEKTLLTKDRLNRMVRVFYNDNSEGKNDSIWVIDTADLYDRYIIMDDGDLPYSKCGWEKIKIESTDLVNSKEILSFGKAKPKNMMVPLSKRMFLEAEDAYDLFVDNLSRTDFGIRAKTGLDIGTMDNPIVLRMFLATSRHFRQTRVKDLEGQGSDAVIYYSTSLFPKFVWVCEIYTIDSYLSDEPKVEAELVIDATSSSHDLSNVIIFNYGSTIKVSNSLDAERDFLDNGCNDADDTNTDAGEDFYDFFYDVQKPVKLHPYTHNLHLPTNKYN